ncbi:MAG: hypothetical protein ABIJ57_01585 [Pseudomonadota bacterium]
MKLKYMIEYALRDRNRAPRYEPIGVWVQGPGPGLDLGLEILPGHTEAEEEAQWVINRLVEQGVRSLGEDFLDYHHRTLSPYRGMRGPLAETDEYPTAEACARSIITIMMKEHHYKL